MYDYIGVTIDEDNIYKIWFVRKNRVMYTESSDLKNFSKPIDLNIHNEDNLDEILEVLKKYE